MIALTAAFGLALIAPQETCGASDTACRIRQLERRVEALERRLGGQTRSAGIEMAVDIYCYDAANCLRLARRACEDAGFARGVPANRGNAPGGSGYRFTRATCTD